MGKRSIGTTIASRTLQLASDGIDARIDDGQTDGSTAHGGVSGCWG